MADISTVEEAERRSGWRTIRKVAPYLWPADKPWVRRRVVLSMIALFVAKLVAVLTPFLVIFDYDAIKTFIEGLVEGADLSEQLSDLAPSAAILTLPGAEVPLPEPGSGFVRHR